MSGTDQPFDGFALVELLGHRQVAGHVREVQVAGAGFLRIDVYRPGDTEPVATQMYSPSALYGLHPCTEELAREYAAERSAVPTALYGLAARPAPRALPPADDVEELHDGEVCACGHMHRAGEDGEDEGCSAGDACACLGWRSPAEFVPVGPVYVPEPDPVCVCGHMRSEHSGDRADDFVCQVSGCVTCKGFDEDLPF